MWVPECSAITSSAEALDARLPQARLVAAVQLQQHARLVHRPHRRARVARLLEVVGAGAGEASLTGAASLDRDELLAVGLGQEAQREIAST